MKKDHLPSLLFVEDHTDTRVVLAKILRSWGFSVIPASNVAAAREALQTQPVELILSDIGLPDGNGWDFFAEARTVRRVHGLALSAWGTQEDKTRSARAGFRRHLIKPVEVNELRDALLDLVACAQREQGSLSS